MNKVLRLQNPYLYQEAATIPTNQNVQHLYLPGGAGGPGPVIRKPAPSQRQPTYVDDESDANSKHQHHHHQQQQPQKITKNVYVTPLIDVVIPQHSYQLNSDVHNNEVSE